MHVSHTQFKIAQLKQDKILFVLESIAMIMLAFFINVFLPSLLFQYLYADQQLTEEPALLQYIPVVTFSAALLFVIYAMVTNMMRASKIKKLERELVLEMSMGDDCCCGGSCDHDHGHHHDEMMEEEMSTPKKRSSKK